MYNSDGEFKFESLNIMKCVVSNTPNPCRPSSRSSRTSCKAARSRERQSSAESTGTTRDTTPTRRTPRQNNRAATKERSPEPARERGLAVAKAAAIAARDNKEKAGVAAAAAATKDPLKEKEVTREKEVERKEPFKDRDAQLKDKRIPTVVLKDTKIILKEKSPQSQTKDKDKSPIQGTKTRKDSEQSEPDASNRRKTRSTATSKCEAVVVVDVLNIVLLCCVCLSWYCFVLLHHPNVLFQQMKTHPTREEECPKRNSVKHILLIGGCGSASEASECPTASVCDSGGVLL